MARSRLRFLLFLLTGFLLAGSSVRSAKLPLYPGTDTALLAERSNVLQVDRCIANGKYLFRYMRYPEAARFLSTATNLAGTIGYDTAFMDSANTLALLLRETGRTNDCRSLLLRLFDRSFHLKKKNRQIISDILNNLSLVEIEQGFPAAGILERLKRAARINTDPVKALVIENNRRSLEIREGAPAKAIPGLKSLTLKAEKKGWYEPLVTGLLLIARARGAMNEPKAVSRALDQAVDRAAFWEYKKGLDRSLRLRIEFKVSQNDFKGALQDSRALLVLHQSMLANTLLEEDKARIRQLGTGP